MRTAITIIISILACLSVGANDIRLTSRRVTTADGLAGNTIYELTQDEQGYIWMATSNGLSRYDGYSTVKYTSLSSDADHHLEARIGRIFHDANRHLLWVSTATFQNACYDLSLGRFIDWTGTGDQYRNQDKLMLTRRGMVLYGLSTGATLCGMTDGQPWVQHYKKELKTLPSDDVVSIVEDSAHNIWINTDMGFAVVHADRADRQPNIVCGGRQSFGVITATASSDATYILTRDGTAYGFDRNGKKILEVQIPAAIGRPGKVNISFTWQGRWLLFTPDGTYAMNLSDGTFSRPQQWQVTDGLNQGSLPGYHFIGTRTGQLWIFPDQGEARRLDLMPNARYITNKGWLFHVAADNRGRLFIATYGNGLFVYATATGALTHYCANDTKPIIGTDYLLCAITDHQGCIWIGSETAGAYCLAPLDQETASYLLPVPTHRGDWSNTITAIAQNKKGQIIIGTREGNIYEHNGSGLRQTGHRQANITALLTDSRGRQWTGTWGDGLYCDDQRYCTSDSAHHLPSDIISDIVEDRNGHIWVGTWKAGILMLDDDWHQYLADDANGSRINDLLLTSDGRLWAASNKGICRWNGHEFETYNTENQRFPHDEVHTLCSDGSHTLWAGTGGGGVIKCTLDDDGNIIGTETITTREGLSNNNVTTLVSDGHGYLWAGTEDGISRIRLSTQNVAGTYRFAESLQGNSFSNHCVLTTDEGQLMFGTAEGLLIVAPETLTIQSTHQATQPAITDLHVNGTSMHENGRYASSGLQLRHDENSLKFFFSNFQYDRRRQPVYQYYLEGLEHQWRSITPEHYADYSKLPPGSYTLHVRSLSETGEWSEEATFDLVIRQPWWNTWWAWLVYLLLLAGAAYYVYRNWRERFRLHQQMKIDRQLSEFRQNLFTNITHEFRTPLAIIKGAVDKLSQDSGNRAALQTVQRGSSRLLRLVNQFMEFRKISTGNLRLQVEQGDIIAFVRDIVQDFWAMAQQKDIQLTFTPPVKSLVMPFDRQMVETIVYNLLSNAVKYTPERGSITMRIKTGADIAITVEDSGPGISAKQQAELFKPFMHGYASQGGMGIGLYTAHQMAMAHKGTLSYEALEPGSRFTLTLPATDDAYEAADYRQTDAISQAPADIATTAVGGLPADIIREMQPEAFNDQTVAIIEDNPDMMEQIRQEVGVYFRTVGYSTGEAGIAGITENPPALLICDVMLPDTNGYQIINRLKTDARTANVPVIMLTALANEQHQIRAYRAGADDYMVKPCNFRLLIARAIQLIKWRMAQKPTNTAVGGSSQSEASQGSSTPDNIPTAVGGAPANITLIESHQDKLFKEKLEVLTARHLSEEDFSVDRLAELTKMGRTKFYGKVKELTGMSPNKYLQEARMKLAAQLLLEGELTVAEISYKVGIQDPSYFNKLFKAKYGVVPSKYGKTGNIENNL